LLAGANQRGRRAGDTRLIRVLEACEIRGEVGDVLIGEARGLRMHRVVRARAAPVALQRDLEVIRVLSAELRHVEGRLGVSVAWYRVPSGAGRRELLAAVVIPFDRQWREGRLRLLRQRNVARRSERGENEGLPPEGDTKPIVQCLDS